MAFTAKVLLGDRAGTFTELGATSMTASYRGAVASAGEPGFLDTPVALRFDRDGDGPEARYRNRETSLFLDRCSLQVRGSFLRYNARRTGSGAISPRGSGRAPCK
jgi:hypothetical protein